ncbi:hypothetical protein Tco_0947091 [Tanacetum coccineum]
MGTRHAKPYTLRGGSSTKLVQRLFKTRQSSIHPKNSSIPNRILIVSIFAQSVAPSVGPVTNSPVQTESITTKPRDILFWHDKRERDDTTPRTFKNAPLTNPTTTSNNLEPLISPAFVEANYEVLESLLRERRRQMHNEDLPTELEYFSEEENF